MYPAHLLNKNNHRLLDRSTTHRAHCHARSAECTQTQMSARQEHNRPRALGRRRRRRHRRRRRRHRRRRCGGEPGALRVRGGGAGGERRPPRASAALNVRPRPSGTQGRLHTTRRRRPPLDGGRRRWRCHRWRWRGGVGWAAGVAGASSDVALRRQGGALDTGPAPFPFPRPPPKKLRVFMHGARRRPRGPAFGFLIRSCPYELP